MADKRAEARRRRVLENPSERLKRLQNLSRMHESSHETVEDLSQEQCHNHKEKSSTEINDQPKINGEVSEKGDHNDRPESSYVASVNNCPEDQGGNRDENESAVMNDKSEIVFDNRVSEKEDSDVSCEEHSDIYSSQHPYEIFVEGKESKPSWIRRKYRLLLFVLLAWSIYMVVVKEFDFVLAFVIGHRLPNDILPILIPTTFIAVEAQVLIVSLFLPKPPVEKPPSAMLTLALSFCGIPKNVSNLVGRITSLLVHFLTDLSVYVFVIVFLKTLDENI